MPEQATHRKLPVWLREVLITLAMGVAIFIVVGVIQRERQRGGGGDLPVGAAATPFVLRDAVGGRTWHLDELRGKPVILNFWATWCGACRLEMPELEELHRKAGGRYHVLTISAEPAAVLSRFSRERGLTLPVLSDPSGQTLARYDVNAFPTVVILDADGRIVHDFEGPPQPGILAAHMSDLAASPR